MLKIAKTNTAWNPKIASKVSCLISVIIMDSVCDAIYCQYQLFDR